MNAQPWWALPLFTLGGVVLTQAGNIVADQLRRRAERSTRWDKDKAALYRAYQNGCKELLRIPVWAAEPTATPPPTRPVLVAAFQRNEELSDLAHRDVIRAANAAAAAAHLLAQTIDDVRRTTRRGPGGAVDEEAGVRLAEARRRLGAAVDAFAAAWRLDLGITAPYTASLSLEEQLPESPETA